jgi:hypothetical protein
MILVEYQTDYFIRPGHPSKLTLFLFDVPLRFHGKWARRVFRAIHTLRLR